MTDFSLVCGCGCETLSDPLGKDYLRVFGNRKWYADKCVPTEDVEVIKDDFCSGKIVKEEDF